MGEEYGETAPFQYFTSHSDPDLVEAVRRGRREEFRAFQWMGEPPDPQNEETFLRSKLNHSLRREKRNRLLLEFYRDLIRLRQRLSPLTFLSKDSMEILGREEEKVLWVRRRRGEEEVFLAFNFGNSRVTVNLPVPVGDWRKQFDSEDERWEGKGSLVPDPLHSAGEFSLSLHPKSFTGFSRNEEV
jgi:maltooligosyltrehalose trehalohydrolase